MAVAVSAVWKMRSAENGVCGILLMLVVLGCVVGKPVEVGDVLGCDCVNLGLMEGDHEAVCGEDGLMYATGCVALCQDVRVQGKVSEGCGNWGGVGIAHPEHFGEEAGAAGKFAHMGFRYLGVANRTRQAALHKRFMEVGRVEGGDVKREEFSKWRKGQAKGKENQLAAQVDMMYTSDGHVYGRNSPVTTELWEVQNPLRRGLRQMERGSTREEETQFLSIFGDNGADDRAEVTDTKQEPFKQIGYIDPIGCTGSLVGRRHVLTAGHCTYSLEHGVWYPVTFRFSPAKTKDSRPYGTVEYENIMVKGCFTTAGLPECDFAVIYLKEDIGDKTGYFGVGLDCDSSSVNLHIAGYPSDKPDQSMWKESCGSASVSCSPDPKLIVHACDVVEGTSGSPLWDDTNKVRAIHKGAVFTRDLRYGNIAVYITPYVHDNIKQWLDQSG